jgi:hypothetical protein
MHLNHHGTTDTTKGKGSCPAKHANNREKKG